MTVITELTRVSHDVAQRSDEWYDLRRGILTASTVGQMLTPTLRLADNDTSRALIAALVAERITGHSEPGYVSPDMWRGIEEEPRARDLYAEVHGVEVQEVGFMTISAPGWTLGYSPDGLVGDDGLIEIKCPRAKGHLATILADEVPAKHIAQMQAGMLVAGRKWCDYVSFCGGMPPYFKRVEFDVDYASAIVAAVLAFEETAAQMVATYTERTAGLPVPERIDYYEEIR